MSVCPYHHDSVIFYTIVTKLADIVWLLPGKILSIFRDPAQTDF